MQNKLDILQNYAIKSNEDTEKQKNKNIIKDKKRRASIVIHENAIHDLKKEI